MDGEVEEEATERASEDEALDPLLLAPAAVLVGLPDAVVAAARDGRIVFVNAIAEELFGYPRRELLGQPVQTLWPERLRERYTRNMELYFATEHPMKFSTAAWGLRRDGSEFMGEMSWGIVETSAGALLLAVGRDISDRHAAEARLRAVAMMGGRALAGADPTDLAGEAIERLVKLVPVAAADVRLADGSSLASHGPDSEAGLRFAIGNGDELLVAPARALAEEELSFVRPVANTLATALARLRDEERMRHEAVHDPLTGLANRTLLRDRLEHALARSERERGATGACSSTSTTSSRSTMPTGTRRAMRRSWTWAGACRRPCARVTRSRGWVATSSSPCARTWTRARRSRSAGVCWRRSDGRSPPEMSSTNCRPASASRWATPILTCCSPTRMQPPIAPRRPAAYASSCSEPQVPSQDGRRRGSDDHHGRWRW